MEAAFFYGVVLLALFYAGKGLLSSGPNFVALPSLFATVVLLWVVPQLFLIRLAYPHLEQPLIIVYAMTALSMLGTRLGWSIGVSHGRYSPIRVPSDHTLYYTTVGLTFIAVVTALPILGESEGVGGAQTGIITILLFFNSVKIVALFLSLYLVLRHKRRASIILLVINLFVFAPFIFLYFRRQTMVEAVICVVLCLWFARRVVVPRFLFLATIGVGYLVISAVGELRALATADGGWRYLEFDDLRAISFFAIESGSDNSNYNEMLNAVHLVQLTELEGGHTLGKFTWNRFIFQWVPAQVVGFETKMSLMFENNITERLFSRLSYKIPTGSTTTGIAEAYLELSYFGMLFFTATAYVQGRWWARAHRGDPWAMAYFVGGLVLALMSITHSTIQFFNGVFLLLIMVTLIRIGVKALTRAQRRGPKRPILVS